GAVRRETQFSIRHLLVLVFIESGHKDAESFVGYAVRRSATDVCAGRVIGPLAAQLFQSLLDQPLRAGKTLAGIGDGAGPGYAARFRIIAESRRRWRW